jgi:hypothetical protein
MEEDLVDGWKGPRQKGGDGPQYFWNEAAERTLRALDAVRLEIGPLSLEDIFTNFVQET